MRTVGTRRVGINARTWLGSGGGPIPVPSTNITTKDGDVITTKDGTELTWKL